MEAEDLVGLFFFAFFLEFRGGETERSRGVRRRRENKRKEKREREKSLLGQEQGEKKKTSNAKSKREAEKLSEKSPRKKNNRHSYPHRHAAVGAADPQVFRSLLVLEPVKVAGVLGLHALGPAAERSSEFWIFFFEVG